MPKLDRIGIVVQRQSMDWRDTSLTNSDAARKIASHIIGKDKRDSFERQTLRYLDLWDTTFSRTFFACRQAMKEIAQGSWARIHGLSGVFTESTYAKLEADHFGKEGFIAFTDDDDWYSPSLFDVLSEQWEGSAQIVVWPRTATLLNGEVHRVQHGFGQFLTYTNNYAIVGTALTSESRTQSVMQHGFAEGQINAEIWAPQLVEGVRLSITHKNPCSWNGLKKAHDSDDPEESLRQMVRTFASSPVPSSSDPEIGWAADLLETSKAFFRGVPARG